MFKKPKLLFFALSFTLLAGCGAFEERAPMGSIDLQYEQTCLEQASGVCTCFPDEARPKCITFRARLIDYEAFCPIDRNQPSVRKDCPHE